MKPARPASLLGGLTPAQFLKDHWQKKPLLVRQAVPQFRGFLDPSGLCRLAARPDAVSRTVMDTQAKNAAARFKLREGPFKKLDVTQAPKNWSLLVQGIEAQHDEGWALLQLFNFVPTSRVDDLMVSWATTGGGVGAHSDLYDVFLLQGSGRRRWRIEEGGDLSVVGGDMRVLKHFKPQQEWVLEPGDMLYLPPDVAHEGVSLDDHCMTWSIGFTQPTHAQLSGNFLAYLDMQEPEKGILQDPDLKESLHPAELTDDSITRVNRSLACSLGLTPGSTFDQERVAGFLGRLSTGRPDVDYEAPRKPLTKDAFSKRLHAAGTLRLSRKTRMLFRGRRLFVNGEEIVVPPPRKNEADVMELLIQLADQRALVLPARDAAFALLAYDLYVAGFVVLS